MTLRIQKTDERGRMVFRLSGRLQAEQIPELQALLRPGASDQPVVLDLREVKLVDRDAVRFLAQTEAEGTRLINCPGFIRTWISQECNGAQSNIDLEAQQL